MVRCHCPYLSQEKQSEVNGTQNPENLKEQIFPAIKKCKSKMTEYLYKMDIHIIKPTL